MKLRPRPHAPRRGLTLLEVILSLAILLISLVAVSRLVEMGTDRELDARMNNTAVRLAQAKLAEFEMGVTSLDTQSGDFENDTGWSWSMTSDTQGTNLFLISVTVSRDVRGRPFSLTLSQMILDPAAKGAAVEAARPE